MKRSLLLLTILLLTGFAAEAGEITRVYHNGKPPAPAEGTQGNIMTVAMQSVNSGETYSNFTTPYGSNARAVWGITTPSNPSPYSRYNLVAGRMYVSDYIRSSRGYSTTYMPVLSVPVYYYR